MINVMWYFIYAPPYFVQFAYSRCKNWQLVMLKVSGLRSEHSDQVSKLLKYVADVSRKIEEKHQVCSIQFQKMTEESTNFLHI